MKFFRLLLITVLLNSGVLLANSPTPKIAEEDTPQLKKSALSEFAIDYDLKHTFPFSGKCQVSEDNIFSIITDKEILIFDSDEKLLDRVPNTPIEKMPPPPFRLTKPDPDIIELPIGNTGRRIVFTRHTITGKERAGLNRMTRGEEIKIAKEVSSLKKEIRKIEKKKSTDLKLLERKRRRSLIKKETDSIDGEEVALEDFEYLYNKIIQETFEEKKSLEENLLPLYQKKSDLFYKKKLMERKKIQVKATIYDDKYAKSLEFAFPDNDLLLTPFSLTPATITIDSLGNLYGVNDTDNLLIIFDQDGNLTEILDNPNTPILNLAKATSLLVDNQQSIYIVQPEKILKLSSFGYMSNFDNSAAGLRNIVGSISSDETWSGKVLIRGETRVETDVILTIEPGTKIIFTDPQSYLIVFGSIVASGDPKQFIVFSSHGENEAVSSQAGKVMIQNAYRDDIDLTREIIFKYCSFRHMDIALYNIDYMPSVSNCDFQYNRLAISYYIYTKDLDMPNIISHCNITNNDSGIQIVTNGPNPMITQSNIHANYKSGAKGLTYNLSYSGYIPIHLENNFWELKTKEEILDTFLITSIPELESLDLENVVEETPFEEQVLFEPFLIENIDYIND